MMLGLGLLFVVVGVGSISLQIFLAENSIDSKYANRIAFIIAVSSLINAAAICYIFRIWGWI